MFEQLIHLASLVPHWVWGVAGILAIPLTGNLICRHFETKEWNDGYCQRCHHPWRSFDMDSGGATGYTCHCNRHIWLSWIHPKEVGYCDR